MGQSISSNTGAKPVSNKLNYMNYSTTSKDRPAPKKTRNTRHRLNTSGSPRLLLRRSTGNPPPDSWRKPHPHAPEHKPATHHTQTASRRGPSHTHLRTRLPEKKAHHQKKPGPRAKPANQDAHEFRTPHTHSHNPPDEKSQRPARMTKQQTPPNSAHPALTHKIQNQQKSPAPAPSQQTRTPPSPPSRARPHKPPARATFTHPRSRKATARRKNPRATPLVIRTDL